MRREAKVLRAAAISTGLYSGNRIDSTNCISPDSVAHGPVAISREPGTEPPVLLKPT